MKGMIFEKTGFLPSITKNGTLKELCESQEGIVRIIGDYNGGIGGR